MNDTRTLIVQRGTRDCALGGVVTGKMEIIEYLPGANIIIVKEAGHTFWASMFEPNKYAGATIWVFQIVGYEQTYDSDSTYGIRVDRLGDCPLRPTEDHLNRVEQSLARHAVVAADNEPAKVRPH